MPSQCASCGSARLERGRLQATGNVHFRPDEAKFLKLKTADVELAAEVCVDCGAVSLLADKEKLGDLVAD